MPSGRVEDHLGLGEEVLRSRLRLRLLGALRRLAVGYWLCVGHWDCLLLRLVLSRQGGRLVRRISLPGGQRVIVALLRWNGHGACHGLRRRLTLGLLLICFWSRSLRLAARMVEVRDFVLRVDGLVDRLRL